MYTQDLRAITFQKALNNHIKKRTLNQEIQRNQQRNVQEEAHIREVQKTMDTRMLQIEASIRLQQKNTNETFQKMEMVILISLNAKR